MSWVDLAALTLMLWSAVKGYIAGGYLAFMHFCALVAALGAATFLQNPLAEYLNGEWRAEAYFVDYLARNVDTLQKTGFSLQQGLELPPLAGRVMMWLLPEAAVLPVYSRETALTLFAVMLVRFLSMALFFFFLAGVFTYLLRIRHLSVRHQSAAEWQKVAGLFFGGGQGFLLAVVFCLLLDAFSVITHFVFLQQDLAVAYLSVIAEKIIYLLPL